MATKLLVKFYYLVVDVADHISVMWIATSVCEELVLKVILPLSTLLG
jgi:hypothetical protein